MSDCTLVTQTLMLGTYNNYFYFTINFYFRNTNLTSVPTLLTTFFKVNHFGVATLRRCYKLECYLMNMIIYVLIHVEESKLS